MGCEQTEHMNITIPESFLYYQHVKFNNDMIQNLKSSNLCYIHSVLPKHPSTRPRRVKYLCGRLNPILQLSDRTSDYFRQKFRKYKFYLLMKQRFNVSLGLTYQLHYMQYSEYAP